MLITVAPPCRITASGSVELACAGLVVARIGKARFQHSGWRGEHPRVGARELSVVTLLLPVCPDGAGLAGVFEVHAVEAIRVVANDKPLAAVRKSRPLPRYTLLFRLRGYGDEVLLQRLESLLRSGVGRARPRRESR